MFTTGSKSGSETTVIFADRRDVYKRQVVHYCHVAHLVPVTYTCREDIARIGHGFGSSCNDQVRQPRFDSGYTIEHGFHTAPAYHVDSVSRNFLWDPPFDGCLTGDVYKRPV